MATAAPAAALPLRLLGGVAVWCTCPSARVAPLQRSCGDADFIGRSGDRKRITAFMEQEGYAADRKLQVVNINEKDVRDLLALLLGDYGLQPGQQDVVRSRLGALGEALDAAPKRAKWKIRARIGERVRWYEEPEEARA